MGKWFVGLIQRLIKLKMRGAQYKEKMNKYYKYEANYLIIFQSFSILSLKHLEKN